MDVYVRQKITRSKQLMGGLVSIKSEPVTNEPSGNIRKAGVVGVL